MAKYPSSISGRNGHNTTFRAACILHQKFHLNAGEMMTVLRQYNQRCIPPWSQAELEHKVQSALNQAPNNPGHRPEKVKFNPALLRSVATNADHIHDLELFLKVRSNEVTAIPPTVFLSKLYPPGTSDRILIFTRYDSQGDACWRADQPEGIRNKLIPRCGKDGVWFLPQPVTGLWHANPRQGGKLSRRSEESVTTYRFLVLESDEADKTDWTKALIQMPLPIASICESGGRSIHALVYVGAKSKKAWDSIVRPYKPLFIELGADQKAISAIRLTRLPQALRNGKLQKLLYFDPEPDSTPIVNKAAVRNS